MVGWRDAQRSVRRRAFLAWGACLHPVRVAFAVRLLGHPFGHQLSVKAPYSSKRDGTTVFRNSNYSKLFDKRADSLA